MSLQVSVDCGSRNHGLCTGAGWDELFKHDGPCFCACHGEAVAS